MTRCTTSERSRESDWTAPCGPRSIATLEPFRQTLQWLWRPEQKPFDSRGRLHDFPHRLVGRSSLTDDPRPTGGPDSSGRHVDHTLKQLHRGVGQQPQITNCISNFFSFEERGPLGHDVRNAFAAKYFFKNPRKGVHPVQHRHLRPGCARPFHFF